MSDQGGVDRLGDHLPIVYSSMIAAEADSGEWASQHQTIAWTETVFP